MKLIAIWLAKLSLLFTRLFRLGSGTTLPGLLAEFVDSDIIKKISKRFEYGVVVVTGTNGKTTAAKMLTEILVESGFTVLNNPSGSNLTRGIASSLIHSVNVFGTGLNADIAVFEVDEATMPEAMTKLWPKLTVVTNLFRDQLDRYGELDKTAMIVGGSLRGFADMITLLNADDPLVADLKKYAEGPVKFFGVEAEGIGTESKAAMDSKDCLGCGNELTYKTRYFGHLGIWKCEKCGQARPRPEYVATDVTVSPKSSSFTLITPEEKTKIELGVTGLYNIYNALAAGAAAELCGSGGPATSHALRNFSAAFGRMEILKIKEKEVMLLLIKNPTGANQALSAIYTEEKPKNILIALNDNFADGTDVSWIWDIDFEYFDLSKTRFIASGIRAEDIALRLKYAGVEAKNIVIEKDVVRATEILEENTSASETGYVLPTYTAMMEIRSHFTPEDDELKKLGKVTKRGI